jgi:hypothetical protein
MGLLIVPKVSGNQRKRAGKDCSAGFFWVLLFLPEAGDCAVFSLVAVGRERFKNGVCVRYSYCVPGVASANPGFIFMDQKKATLFIDSSNFYHSLKENKLFGANQ